MVVPRDFAVDTVAERAVVGCFAADMVVGFGVRFAVACGGYEEVLQYLRLMLRKYMYDLQQCVVVMVMRVILRTLVWL